MRRRASTIGDGEQLESDVAIVGAGPLGIVVALELARAGRRVLVIESGHDRFDPETQALADTAGEDPFHAPMEIAVRRQVGGTSTIWGGRCVPFDAVDFDPRFGSSSPWPVSFDEIAQYHQRACDWCICGRAIFCATALPEIADRQLIPGLPDERVKTTDLERWSRPTNFGQVYGRELTQRQNVDLITGLTCTRIVCGADRFRVSHLVARSLHGPTLTIRAKAYVLATGGLDAVRLMFASSDRHPGGIGNHSGLLGRGYMAHVEGRVARIRLTTPPDETIYGHERDRDGVYVRRRFTFDRAWLNEKQMRNAAIWLVNPELGDASHGNAVLSFVYLLLRSPFGGIVVAEAIRRLHIRTTRPTTLRAHYWNVLKGFLPAVSFALTFGYKRFLRRGAKAPGFFVKSTSNTYHLHYHGEHRPHQESFVEPTDVRDALDLPRLRTHIHYSDEDIASLREALVELDSYVREHGVGSIEWLHDDVDAAVRRHLLGAGGYHQTGIARMSSRPEDGVVDGNLAVHGFRDLFVASTATFPVSGQANPTFTGVAFAVRLADHLRQCLADEDGAGRAGA